MASIKNTMVIFLLLSTTSCGIFIGNVKPVSEKAKNYSVIDLSRTSKNWTKLQNTNDLSNPNKATRIPDIAFQSPMTSSIISIDSSCHSNVANKAIGTVEDLRELTRTLFMGLTHLIILNERKLTLQNMPALKTTVEGELENQKPVLLQTVVLRRRDCVYDFIYIAKPDIFNSQIPDFTRFVSSFRFTTT